MAVVSVASRIATELNATMSLHNTLNVGPADLPPHLLDVLAEQPANVDRRTGAELITRHFFPISYRSLEAWSLPTRRVNGKAIVPTVKLFEIAFAKLTAAPVVMGGRKTASQQQTP